MTPLAASPSRRARRRAPSHPQPRAHTLHLPAQTKYKNKYRERVERQYRIVKPDVTREEIDAAFEGGPNAQPQIFTQQILQGPGHASARNALADIQEKHRDIMKLEASIAELHQLFLDMSVLVESQARSLPRAATPPIRNPRAGESRPPKRRARRVRSRDAHMRCADTRHDALHGRVAGRAPGPD